MDDMTIAGVPAVVARSAYTDLITSLGIDPDQLVELHFGWNTITAVVYAINAQGKRYVDEQKMEPAVHHISIQVVDEGTTCPYCSKPEGWDACPIHRDGTPTTT